MDEPDQEQTIVCPHCGGPAVHVGKYWVCPEHGPLPETALPLPPPGEPLNIFLSYGHDPNEPLVQRIKVDLESRRGHNVWFDQNPEKEKGIRPGDDWRRAITEGIAHSDRVLSILSRHSTRDPGVCRDEIGIALGVRSGSILTILVESESNVQVPNTISHIQWLDMHDWEARRTAAGDPDWEAWPWYQARFAEIVRTLESDESRRFAGEITELEGHLAPVTQEARVYELLTGFGGRDWLFEAVERWRTGDRRSRLFWIKGDPGVGKSAFAANLAHFGHDRVIAAHFCQYDKPEHRDPRRLVRTIAFQIATRLPDYRKLLLCLRDIGNLDGKTAAELFDYLLANPLRTAIDGGRERYLVIIDALDEAKSGSRNELVEMLRTNLSRLPDWIGLLVTSRPESDVTGPLSGLHVLHPYELDTAGEPNRDDIRDYLRRSLKDKLAARANADAIIEQVLANSEGVFLYAKRFCEDVEEGHISLDHPEAFPAGLHSSFYHYFERQFPDEEGYRRRVRPALRAILAAAEPLPTAVLQSLLDCREDEVGDFTRSLGSLFPVTISDGQKVIRPYHRALREWLTESSEGDGTVFSVSVAEGHKLLADTGWVAFQRDSGALHPYLLRYLPHHLCEADRGQNLQMLASSASYLDALWNEFGPGAVREVIRLNLSKCLDDDRVADVWDAGRVYFGMSRVNRSVIEMFRESLVNGRYAAARGIANSVDDRPVRVWLLGEGLAHALVHGGPSEGRHWREGIESTPCGKLGPVLSALSAPTLTRLGMAGNDWHEAFCRWCDDQVIYEVSWRLCELGELAAAHHLIMTTGSNMYRARHAIGLSIIRHDPEGLDSYKMALQTLSGLPFARMLLQYSRDFARAFLDCGYPDAALRLHGPGWWNLCKKRYGTAMFEKDPWPTPDERPTRDELLRQLQAHEIEEPRGGQHKDAGLAAVLAGLCDPFWGAVASPPTALTRAAECLDADENVVWHAWVAAGTRLAGNEADGWEASVSAFSSWRARTDALEEERRDLERVRELAEDGHAREALSMFRDRILFPRKRLTAEEEDIRKAMLDEYLARFKKGLVSADPDILLEAMGVETWKEGKIERDFSWLLGCRPEWDSNELGEVSERLCSLLAGVSLPTAEDTDEREVPGIRMIDTTDSMTDNALRIAEAAARLGRQQSARSLCARIRQALEATEEPGRNFSIYYARTLKLQAAVGDAADARETLANAVQSTAELSLAVSLPLLGGLAVVETMSGNLPEARRLFSRAFAETENLEYDRLLYRFSNDQVEGLVGRKKPEYLRDKAEEQVLGDLEEALGVDAELATTDFLLRALAPVQSLKSLTRIVKRLHACVTDLDLASFQGLFENIGASPEFAALRLELGELERAPDILQELPNHEEAFAGLMDLALRLPVDRCPLAIDLIAHARERAASIRAHKLHETFGNAAGAFRRALKGSEGLQPTPAVLAEALDVLLALSERLEPRDQVLRLHGLIDVASDRSKEQTDGLHPGYRVVVRRLSDYLVPRLPALYYEPPMTGSADHRGWKPQIEKALPLLDEWYEAYHQKVAPMQERYSDLVSRFMAGEYELHDEYLSLERCINMEPDKCGGFLTACQVAFRLSRALQKTADTKVASYLRHVVLEGLRGFPRRSDYLKGLLQRGVLPLMRAFSDAGERDGAAQTLALLDATVHMATPEERDDVTAALFGYSRVKWPGDGDWSEWSEEHVPAIVRAVSTMLRHHPGGDYSCSEVLRLAVENSAEAGFAQAASDLLFELQDIASREEGTEFHEALAGIRVRPLAKLGLAHEVRQILVEQGIDMRLRSIRETLNTPVSRDSKTWRYMVEQAVHDQELFERLVRQRLPNGKNSDWSEEARQGKESSNGRVGQVQRQEEGSETRERG